jgi:hypothetical protein
MSVYGAQLGSPPDDPNMFMIKHSKLFSNDQVKSRGLPCLESSEIMTIPIQPHTDIITNSGEFIDID